MRNRWSKTLAITWLAAFGMPVYAGEVVGIGNFSHIVSDLGRAMDFYEQVLGLEISTPPTQFSPNPAIMRMGNTPGAQSRIAAYSIPGSELGIELIEYKDIARGHAQIRFQDPGATVLQLRIRDMDAILERLADSTGRIWTPSGDPVPFGDGLRIIFVQDPDGIFIELIEDRSAPSGDNNIYGASFELIIDSTDETAAFYSEGIGALVDISADFDRTPSLHQTVATNGAAFRRSSTTIPATGVGLAFLEFREIYRKPLATKVQDPGTSLLQLIVDDVPAMVDRLVAAGGTLITTGGRTVDLGGGVLLAIVRDPNNLYLELLPQR